MKPKVKKIILTIATFLIIFNVILPTKAYAEVTWQGILFDPISFLVCTVGDAINNVSQKLMLPGTPKAIRKRDVNGENKIDPKIFFSPAAIFANKVPSLDVNFISPSIKNDFLTDDNLANLEEEGYTQKEADAIRTSKTQQDSGNLQESGNAAAILQSTISRWYIALRNIALIGLLIVLVYLGIRILISATADEQAKYKKMLTSWVMAIILIAVMHFIMLILLTVIQTLSKMFSLGSIYSTTSGDELFNYIRSSAGVYEQDPLTRMGYTLIYFVVTIYSLMFTIRYIKRVIYMAFLTVIAPMVALTYPLDKAGDGQAQAFNFWFKEYLFNLLIQPVHLLLYIILVSSAIELAKVKMIYALVAIGFILQAEKFIKEMFGIQGEGGAMDGNFVTGMAFGGLMSKLSSGATKLTGAARGIAGKSDKIRMDHSERTKDANAKQLSEFQGKGSKKDRDDKNKDKNKDKKGTNEQTQEKQKDIKLNKPESETKESPLKRMKNKKDEIKRKIRYNPGVRKLTRNPLARGVGNLRRRYVNTNTMKKAGKLAMMLYGGGIGAAMGTAAGLASDDYKNVLTLGATGAAAGATIGKEMTNQAEAAVDGGRNLKDTFDKGFYKDKYEEKKLNPYLDKKWRKDADVIEHFQTLYGEDWDKRMDDALEFRKQGITDQDEIDKGLKLMDDVNNPIEKQLENGEISEEDANKQKVSAAQAANIMSLADVSRGEMLDHRDQIRDKQVLPATNYDEEQADKVMKLLDMRFGTTGSDKK